MYLSDLKIGEKAIVKEILTDTKTTRRLYNLGLYNGVNVKIIRFAPLGCPVEIKIKDFCLALRIKDTKKIVVERI